MISDSFDTRKTLSTSAEDAGRTTILASREEVNGNVSGNPEASGHHAQFMKSF